MIQNQTLFLWNGTYWQYSYFPYLPLRTLQSIEKMVAQEVLEKREGKALLFLSEGRKKYLIFWRDRRGEGRKTRYFREAFLRIGLPEALFPVPISFSAFPVGRQGQLKEKRRQRNGFYNIKYIPINYRKVPATFVVDIALIGFCKDECMRRFP
jgi:hypothetical protein